MDIEENWETVASIKIPLKKDFDIKKSVEQTFNLSDSTIIDFIVSLYSFFREYGFAYLEVNPFAKNTDDEIVCLDMVARLDTCEAFRQKHHW
jgi:succinyl-CoA synthetase beta subunit